MPVTVRLELHTDAVLKQSRRNKRAVLEAFR